MFHRKDAVSMAVVGLLASCGLAMADTTQVAAPALSLEPTVVTAQDSGAPSTPLMMLLDKVGAAKPITNAGINIYGWVEGGYEANLRNNDGSSGRPGPFTTNPGSHFIFNQLSLRVERDVDSKKWDVGGLVEVNFGEDDNFTTPATAADGSNTSGWELTHIGNHQTANPQLDITQAFVDVNVPVGNGLKVRMGRFYTLTGYESFDPRGNPFYTHSLIYNSEPVENTGVLVFYNLNDQWSFVAGASRGINQNTEDDNGAIDGLGQITFTPNKQLQFVLNWEAGPQEPSDTSHYQALVNPIATWQVTDKLKLAGEGIYVYDGALNSPFIGHSHAYGDYYGAAGYASYTINDYLTANARLEWFHSYDGAFHSFSENQYEATLGVTIKPMPKDPIGQNLSIRPEIRYDFAEDHIYTVGDGGNAFRDQWTAGADVIFTF